jgi:hypothetical protein
MSDYNLRYPIGEFVKPAEISSKNISEWIDVISSFYEKLNKEVDSLTKEQWHWQYRQDGWTIQQIVHHCADSHLNAFIRFKLTITESNPTIKPYNEKLWAELSDSMDATIDWSLSLIYGLHKRWAHLMKNLTQEELNKTYFHPEHNKFIKLNETIAHYAWHCTHHLEHIKLAKQCEGKV